MNPSNLSDMPSTSTENTPGGAIAGARQNLKATAQDAATQLKSAATSTAARAREETERFAAEKKTGAADRIGQVGSAIHDSAKSLEEKDPNIAWFTHRAADRVQGVADYLRERDFRAMRNDVEQLARRHPVLFFGGLLLGGLVLGNVLKASRRNPAESAIDENDDYSAWAENPSASGSSEPSVSSAPGI